MNDIIKLINWVRNRKSRENQFFKKSYDERVKEISTCYSDSAKQKQMKGYFDRTNEQIKSEIELNPRLFYDALYGFSSIVKPKVTMQLGCFVATELQWLKTYGLGGKLIGADHSKDYLGFLKDGFSRTPFSEFEYRCFNLDKAEVSDFAGVEMVTAMAVLSNVQPESMDPLFKTMSAAGVTTIIIGDMYYDKTLTGSTETPTSAPLRNVRNWAHPYRALGRRHGYDPLFFPCFTYSSYQEARGVFVLTKGMDQQSQRQAMHLAIDNYLGRQMKVWDSYLG